MLYANGQPVGGGNANEKSLTLAEYNALSEAEKMNGTTYYITDAVPQGKKIQPVIYSNDEREIGVWTDGKPLYQLTMVFPSNFSINGTGTALPNDMQTALADVDALIDAEVCRDNTIASFISPYVYKSSGAWYVIAFDNWGNCKWITFRYTKTTDTAGSGIWTPSGIPAVHYSTNEHVIGTWIDGSTLYERTITASISNRVQWIDTGVDNTSTIVYSEGFLEHSGGIITLASADPDGQVGINTFMQSIVTTGKWSVLYRAKQEHTNLHEGDLTVTIRYTKSS